MRQSEFAARFTYTTRHGHLLNILSPGDVDAIIRRAAEAELDEMWSYVQCKQEPRWLWHVIDHRSGKVLAYVFGRRKDEVLLKRRRSQ